MNTRGINWPASRNASRTQIPNAQIPLLMWLSLHRRPEVVCIEEPGKFWINIDNMDIPLAAIANDSPVEITRFVRFNVNTQRTENLETQSSAS